MGNKEDEGTDLQVIIKEVKEYVFSVYYLLLKDNEISLVKYWAILIIEYI
jgi:hypothetical protein